MNFNKILRPFLPVALLIFISSSLEAQQSGFLSKFQEAVRLDEENELNQSFIIWTQLATDYSDNANINYKAGRAYLQSFNRKSAALPFLQKAATSEVDKNYDPISPYEKKVPVEVYFYYAKALHLNYKLEKAEEYYELFIRNAPIKHFLYPEAELGMQQINNAQVLMKIPVEFEIKNLGSVVNSEYPDFSPVISVDENALFFTSARLRPDSSNFRAKDRLTGLYFEDIYASYKDRDGNWQEPELLSINTTAHTATMNVSVDGQTLYLYKDVNGGDIYQSTLVGEIWSEPAPMPDGINSSAWETHLAITPDEQTIYFVSNRSGGMGGRDIYKANKLPDGKWSKPSNLGPKINTQFDEDAVFISPDSRILYFSSKGHSSIGGFDIMYSKIGDDGEWSAPTNIGYPINTTDDDVFFVTSADGQRAYYSSVRDSGFGEKDIYMINLPDPQAVNLAVLKGTIIPADGDKLPDDIVIYVTNRKTGNSQTYTPRARDGVFIAILPPCNQYDVDYQINGKIAARDTFSIGCDLDYQEIIKELLLSPLIVSTDGTAVIMSSTSGDAIPATFMKFFGYNQETIGKEEVMYANFMKGLNKLVTAKGKAEITIVGSASKVPTSSFESNQVLADDRAKAGKQKILDNAESYGIDPAKLSFKSVKGLVQGPEYQGDYKTGKDTYEKYQYIDVKAE
ncbi:hypothetical protein G3O08_15275 [Cryomorpha ignava]|uniref:OmpA family protein n=1 Tax=Cryomorpha ignava TaxID=101383 RepID=A0A7K3WT45_9FLAO|nr:PD40 domain-containing protein [Cryomorpha ignava]NEN24863.1 hypothetical protein [Cryomorpha ignava]